MAAEDVSDPLLSGAFAPLRAEYDLADVPVEGDLPPALSGTLYRIGPNPRFPPLGPYNPLQGEGMIHAFRIGGGRVAYRNRWVRTRRWRLEDAAGRALFATGDPRLGDASVAGVDGQGAANTQMVFHAGRLLALEEGHPPFEVAPGTLDPIGPYDFGGALEGPMTAHPKLDPRTGEMVFFGNFPDRRFDGALALHMADAAGRLVRSARIAGPYPALVHDFAITARWVVFVVCPLTLSLERLRAGRPPVAWEPGRGSWLGLIPRAGGEASWRPAPPGMAWHTLNAFEADGAIHLDLCLQAAPAFPLADSGADSGAGSWADGATTPEADLRQRLYRWSFAPEGGEVATRRLSDEVCEYPRIDERFLGWPCRYGFLGAGGGPGTGDLLHRAIGVFDHAEGRMALWRAGPGQSVSEPVFAARPGSDREGDGWLLSVVYEAAEDRSWLGVFDAGAAEAGPIARADLPHRVPAGFHGIFVASRVGGR
ncbi:carotenoid oxygenase family protein [Phenylobacterium sp.]|uniref:carotenoid oxygenase family protein n=1 Tax=Phenylobacterium sp. TaxID=1871053 RepID=UPI00301CC3E7